MNKNPGSKKRIPYWRALAVGILITVIGVALITALEAQGASIPWGPLEGPPSGVAKIVTIQWNLLGKVWVKANDGTYYSTHILCSGGGLGIPCLIVRPDWDPVKEISQIPEEEILRGRNCTRLKMGVFPFDPDGEVRECFYSYREGKQGGDVYIALMEDGSLKYWENGRDAFLWTLSCVASIVLSFGVALIISVVYFIIFVVRSITESF